MAKLNCITRASSLIFLNPRTTSSFRTQPHFKPFIYTQSQHSYSTTKTPFPLQYEMIISTPAQSSNHHHHHRRRRPPPPPSLPNSKPSDSDPGSQLGFDDWIDMKLTSESATQSKQNPDLTQPMLLNDEMDKSKRKYYNKRQKRMYGSDSEDDNNGKHENKFIELKQEVVKLRTLHKREEELYFYDAFAYPWEKDKHYKMVYQLEKKFFPDQCFDKAFLEPGESNGVMEEKMMKKKKSVAVKNGGGEKKDEKRLVFFEEEKEVKDVKMDITEKKVEEFFKCLKKVPNEKNKVDSTLPFISSRSSGLPPKWDGPTGAVLLVNKPKGWTSFTVCGKLRRLVNVKKVGHAGTLDPMATGLLIVCIGKATKLVDRYVCVIS